MELVIFAYMAAVLPSIHHLLFVIAMVLLFVCIGRGLYYRLNSNMQLDPDTDGIPSSNYSVSEKEECSRRGAVERIKQNKITTKLAIAAVIAGMLAAATPKTEKQVYLIAGAWAAQVLGEKVVSSETAKLAVEAINLKLNQYLLEEKASFEQNKVKTK